VPQGNVMRGVLENTERKTDVFDFSLHSSTFHTSHRAKSVNYAVLLRYHSAGLHDGDA